MNEPPKSNEQVDPPPGDESGASLCHVVIFALPDDPETLRELLEKQLGLHPTDAHIQAHAVPGLLPGTFTRQQATDLIAGVHALGISAEIVEQSSILHLDAAETIHHAHCSDQGLEIVGLCDRTTTLIVWDDVRLLSVGYVPLETDRRRPVEPTGIVTSGRRTWASSMEVPSLSGPAAFLVCGRSNTAYNIDHNLMNYEYLGDRKTESASRNFRLFAEDVAARARHAYLTPATRAFLDHGILRHFEFRDIKELESDTQFHFLMSNQMGKPAAPES